MPTKTLLLSKRVSLGLNLFKLRIPPFFLVRFFLLSFLILSALPWVDSMSSYATFPRIVCLCLTSLDLGVRPFMLKCTVGSLLRLYAAHALGFLGVGGRGMFYFLRRRGERRGRTLRHWLWAWTRTRANPGFLHFLRLHERHLDLSAVMVCKMVVLV